MPASVRSTGGRVGLVAAYLLVLGLIAVSAGYVFAFGPGTPSPAEAAAAATPSSAPPRPVGSLAVPPRPPSGFRSLPSDERDGMIEVTEERLHLPRISPSGWTPWIAYARRFDPSGPPGRIGVLMINLGIDEALTRRAIEELPGEVSLAFLPGAPELPRWLREARERGHESYLMLPVEDPSGIAERGVRPLQVAVEPDENLRRLRSAMSRAEGYVGFVVPSPGPVLQSETTARPLIKEIADRGLGLIEINPASAGVQQLTAELGAGYARTSNVLDYKLSSAGIATNLDRLAAWAAESPAGQPARHEFGVVQPDDGAIEAIVAWFRRRGEAPPVSFVPVIGHFECRDACLARLRTQPAQLRP